MLQKLCFGHGTHGNGNLKMGLQYGFFVSISVYYITYQHMKLSAAAMLKRCFMRGAFDLIRGCTTYIEEPAGPSYVQTKYRSKQVPFYNQDIQIHKAGVANWLIEKGGAFNSTKTESKIEQLEIAGVVSSDRLTGALCGHQINKP